MKRLLALSLLVIVACTSQAPKENLVQPTAEAPPANFQQLVSKYTRFARKYDGFYETYRAHVTYLTPEIREAQLKERASFMEWDSQKIQSERDRANQEMSTQTVFFLQFFSPDPDFDDLNKQNTIWHVYLEINGRRFDAKVKKYKHKLIEIRALYPEFDRFSTPYELAFNVSTRDAIRHPVKMVIASSVGDSEFVFEPVP